MAQETGRRGGESAGGCRRGRRRGGGCRGRVRDENGQFTDEIDTEEVLAVFDAVEGPIVTSTDVADVLGITTESARQHLNALVSAGTCRRRKTGRTIVYWRVTEHESE
ncbi:FaeA/PapI family transcriptional regulator [Halorhabdus salina]|uniref:FaeA/PapI family transcriptional regulator n=1 Tax=Halorhabdus salina TaxID=2750670 RepID=UPI0015EFC6D3|nr:FaeA/PapI family transcriptional regulator [Halorhabdus salina]